MTFGQYKRAVCVISDRTDVETALKELKEVAFPLDRTLAIGRNDSDELK